MLCYVILHEFYILKYNTFENEILYLRKDWHVKLFLFQLFLPTQ